MRDHRKKFQVKQAVVLCGGFGTRLGKITVKTPKPLLTFNKTPFLAARLMNNYIVGEVRLRSTIYAKINRDRVMIFIVSHS